MPTIRDLYRVRQGLCRGFAISSTTVASDDRDRGMSSKPGLGSCGFTIRQQCNDPAPFQIADVDGPPLVRIVADFWPDRLLSDVRPVCADKARWPRWCSLRTFQAHGRHSWCQCNLRKLARIDRSVLPSTASCKFVGNPPSNLARGPISDQVGMAATGWLYTPPDIIKRQAMRANLLAKATATSFGGFRSSSEASHGVGL